MIWLDVFKHLLPRSRAWGIRSGTVARQIIEGLAIFPDDVRREFDRTFLDIFPATTRALEEWEAQWALPGTELTEAERRSRLDAAWKARGGQSPKYIQDTLQAAGFNVFVFDWWSSGDAYPPTAINPLIWIKGDSQVVSGVDCGELLAMCGDPFALCGNTVTLPGYLLVNRIQSTREEFTSCCGDPTMLCGEEEALCGQYTAFLFDFAKYDTPREPSKWPYMYYIGGEVFGELADVSTLRKTEFETLVLKITPEHLWGGMFINYQ